MTNDRMLRTALVGVALVVWAGCRSEGRTVIADSAAGIVDSAPTATATGVAAELSDENVFALLDTALAVVIVTDDFAQSRASVPAVQEFARRAVSDNSLVRSGVRSTAQRLGISPILPDRDVIAEHQEAMRALEVAQGPDF